MAGVSAAAQSDRQHQPERLSRLSRRTMAADVGGISTTGTGDLVQQSAQSKSLGRVSKQGSHNSEMADTCATAGTPTGANLTVIDRSAQLMQYVRTMPALSVVLSWAAIIFCHALLLAVCNVIMFLFAAAAIPTTITSCIWLSLPRPAACLYADHRLNLKPLSSSNISSRMDM